MHLNAHDNAQSIVELEIAEDLLNCHNQVAANFHDTC